MSYKEVNDKAIQIWPWTARQRRRQQGKRLLRKQLRKQNRNL